MIMSGFQKVKFTLVADGVDFEDVCYFRTESFVGIYNGDTDNYIVLPRHDPIMEVIVIDQADTLEELDQKVYDELDEHIEDVADYAEFRLQEEDRQ